MSRSNNTPIYVAPFSSEGSACSWNWDWYCFYIYTLIPFCFTLDMVAFMCEWKRITALKHLSLCQDTNQDMLLFSLSTTCQLGISNMGIRYCENKILFWIYWVFHVYKLRQPLCSFIKHVLFWMICEVFSFMHLKENNNEIIKWSKKIKLSLKNLLFYYFIFKLHKSLEK